MKKWIALLLAAVLCLSLVACGDSKTEENSGTVQGQTIADSTQNTGEPSDTEFTEQTVEITLDNWQDYFEIKQCLDAYINANAFGEPETFGYFLYTMFTLKEEYADKVDFDGSNVAIEYSGDYIPKSITVNVPDYTYEITGSSDGVGVSSEPPISGMTQKLRGNEINQKVIKDGEIAGNCIELPFSAPLLGQNAQGSVLVRFDGNDYYVEGQEEYQGIVNVLENIEFTRIQGTLVFSK